MTFRRTLRQDQLRWARKNLPPSIIEPLYSIRHPASGHKRIARRFLEESGLAVPHLLASGVSLREALQVVSDTPHCFVKPEHGWGANATLGLVATDTGYANALSGDVGALDKWAWHLRSERIRYGLRDRWMVEELLTRSKSSMQPPDEYKFHAFAGCIELICVRRATWKDRASAVFRWVDADWNPVETGLFEDRVDSSLPLLQGEERAAFMKAAQHVSRQRPVPFTRIDLFRTANGIVGGELTLFPGGVFNSHWRARLTAAWHEAALRVHRGIQSGDLADMLDLNRRVLQETQPIWTDVVRWERLHRISRLARWPLRCKRSSFVQSLGKHLKRW